MFGVLVNVLAIIIGATAGSVIKKGVPEKVSIATMDAIGLFSLFVGISGALKGENAIISLVSLVIGTIIGTAIDIDGHITNCGETLKKKFNKISGENSKFVDAFVTSSVLFGIGAMAILGSINAGLYKDYSIFYLKSTMDLVSSIMIASSMGIGVAFAGITVFVLQGSMTLFANFLKPLAENTALMNEITCCGNILIIGIGINVLGLAKIKIANMFPAMFIVPFVYYISEMI